MRLIFISLILMLCSCGNDLGKRRSLADGIASEAGMKSAVVNTDNFLISSYSKIYRKAASVNIYIEGDGFAWADRGRLSSNPTPHNPLALRLAAADKSENVIYLARPCQYTSFEKDSLCEGRFWAGSRFSNQVISSMNQAINNLKKQHNISDINLVGYSGGAAVAVIIAAKRDDVVSIRTVAGNLDHDAVNKYHKVDLLDDSLNAIDFVKDVSKIAQYHFSGSDDNVVPAFIAENFTKKVNVYSGCAKSEIISNATHHSGWQEKWRELLAESISCEGVI